MKYLIFLLFIPLQAYSQDPSGLTGFDLTAQGGGQWHVYLDSVRQEGYHLNEREAVERSLRLKLRNPNAQVSYRPDYKVHLEAKPIYAEYLNDIEPELRGLTDSIIEDTTGKYTPFRIQIEGTTTAHYLRYSSKCIGYDSTMTAVDERKSMYLYPDSTGFASNRTALYECHKENAMMTYWLTAFNEADEQIAFHAYFIDIAHIRSIGR